MAAVAAKSNTGDTSNFYKTSLGNDEISMDINTKNSQLTIEVANASRFMVHRKTISKPEEVRNITKDFIESSVDLFESIRSALSSDSQCGTVEFFEKRHELVITSKLLAKSVKWTIQMELQETTADVKCNFLVKQNEELKSRVNALEELTSRVNLLEHMLGVVKVQSPLFAAVNVTNYTLSADRKQVTSSGVNTGWQGFLSEQPLSTMGYTFQVQIDVLGSGVMVGLAKRNIVTNGGIYTKNGTWMLHMYGSNYQLYTNGSGSTNGQLNIRNGSRLTVSLTLLTKQLSFELDGALVTLLILPDITDLFAAIDLNAANTSVSFV